MSADRKIRRKKKKDAEKELKQKMSMFEHLPNACVNCFKDFDKKNREMVQSWYVVERRKERKVNLYCPECWSDAKNIIKDMIKKKESELDRILRESPPKGGHLDG